MKDVTELFGTLATIASLGMVFLGLTGQIWRNHKLHSAKGLSIWMFSLAVVTYGLWTVYAWFKPDYFLATCQTPGLVLSVVLLVQILYYRRKEKTRRTR